MAVVDLTPDELKRGYRRLRRLRLWMPILLIVTCAAGLGSALEYLSYARQDRACQQASQRCQQVRRQVDSAAQAKDQLAEYQDRLALIDRLSVYPDCLAVTGFVARYTPELIYLTQISIIPQDDKGAEKRPSASMPPTGAGMFAIKKGALGVEPGPKPKTNRLIKLTIMGRALNHDVVADYLSVLAGSELLTEAKLKHAHRLADRGAETIDFEIECSLYVSR